MINPVLDFFFENLNWVKNCDNPLIANNAFINAEKDQINSLYLEVEFFRQFLKDMEESQYEIEKVKDLAAKIGEVAYEAEDIVDWFVVNAVMKQNRRNPLEDEQIFNCRLFLNDIVDWFVVNVIMKRNRSSIEDEQFLDCRLFLGNVMEELKSIRAEAEEGICGSRSNIEFLQEAGTSRGRRLSQVTSPVLDESFIVGLDYEVMSIVEKLTSERKQLDMIKIVGMAGIGKTTLARKVYNNSLVAYRFHTRAWICVSQNYQKRNVLLGILNSLLVLIDQNSTDEALSEQVYRYLKGRRYLIVIDDIWNTGAWDDLRRSFPDDNNGSRILLTSRLIDVVLHAKPVSIPYFLRFLNEDESWALLQQKVFGIGSCPPGLVETGKQIAQKCHGLPLAIAVIAGLLSKKEKTTNCWKLVAESVGSHIASEPTDYMETLALSYNHLPHHLKSCFLYLGAFPRGTDIPVRRLKWLWAAEGFIQNKREKSLEEVAEDYLMDLIDRSLVIVSQTKFTGGVKACRIHDLLHDLCLQKAKEEDFLQQLEKPFSIPDMSHHRLLFIHSSNATCSFLRPYQPYLRSLIWFSSRPAELSVNDSLFIFQTFMLLRVLDLKSIVLSFFPDETDHLIHLRYLALSSTLDSLPSSISNLSKLETLVFGGLPSTIVLPSQIWRMVNLRHLHIEGPIFIPLIGELSVSFLFNLQTISTLHLSCLNEELLLTIPNIKKLGCISWEPSHHDIPKLDCLVRLETLKIFYRPRVRFIARWEPFYKFPSNLKKLTLSGFHLPWTEMSTLGGLPNLQALKLLANAFKGPLWETSDGEFLQLKFLKFQDLDIEHWNAASDHFPSLQRLVFDRCIGLKEIPCALGDISTLELIETDSSNLSVVNSARQIKDYQHSMGSDLLKVIIYT